MSYQVERTDVKETILVISGILILCVVGCAGCASNIQPETPPAAPAVTVPHAQVPDPEEGVKNFMDAMNQPDGTKLFNLYSEEIKHELSRDYFTNVSLGDPKIVNYTIFYKEIKKDKARFIVQFVLEKPNPYLTPPTPYLPNVTMAFVLEDNQWKLTKP
jgi:hypothetical protein